MPTQQLQTQAHSRPRRRRRQLCVSSGTAPLGLVIEPQASFGTIFATTCKNPVKRARRTLGSAGLALRDAGTLRLGSNEEQPHDSLGSSAANVHDPFWITLRPQPIAVPVAAPSEQHLRLAPQFSTSAQS